MTKKILKKFLILGSFISISSVALFAVSCYEKETNDGKKVEPGSKEELNKMLKNVNAFIDSKSKVKIETAKVSDVMFSDFDNANVSVKIIKFEKDVANKKIKVTFELEHKTSKLKSDSKTTELKFEVSETAKDKIDKELQKITIDYKDKQNTFTANLKEKDLIFSGFDQTFSQPQIIRVRRSPDGISISVIFRLSLKNSTYQTQNRTIDISGFKPSEPVISKTELTDIVSNKIQVGYKDVKNTFSTDANLEGITFDGYDASKFKLSITDFVVHLDEVSESQPALSTASVYIKISPFSDLTNVSETVGMGIFDFKVPTEFSKITFDYPNKAETYSYAADLSKITYSGLDDKNKSISIKGIKQEGNGTSIKVRFTIVDNQTKKESALIDKTIKGFKNLNTKLLKLSFLFLSSNINFLEVDLDKKNDVVDSFLKNKATFTFDTTNNKFVMAKDGEKVDLLDPSTYTQLGTIDKDLVDMYKKIFESSISQKYEILFDQFKALLEANKSEQQSLFSAIKTNASAIEESLKGVLTFDKDWLTNLETLINRDNQKIMLNLRTGQIVIPADGQELDFKDSKTYKVIATATQPTRNEIRGLVVKILRAISDESAVERHIFDSNDISSYYTFEKTNQGIYNSVTFTQKAVS